MAPGIDVIEIAARRLLARRTGVIATPMGPIGAHGTGTPAVWGFNPRLTGVRARPRVPVRRGARARQVSILARTGVRARPTQTHVKREPGWRS